MKTYDVFRFLILFFVFCIGALLANIASAQCPGDQCQMQKGWGWSMVATATHSKAIVKPSVPDKIPGSVCGTCNGSGKVGDGRVFQTCQDCKGTGVTPGRLPASPASSKPAPVAALPASQAPVCVGGTCYYPQGKVYTPQASGQYRTYSTGRTTRYYRRY